MPTRTLTAGFVGTGDGGPYAASVEVEADQWIEGEKTVNATTADQEEVVPFDKDNIQGIFITSDKAVTMETNDATTPDDTLVFVANVPLLWHKSMPNDNPFSLDVTKFFLTNSSTSNTATVKWLIGLNT